MGKKDVVGILYEVALFEKSSKEMYAMKTWKDLRLYKLPVFNHLSVEFYSALDLERQHLLKGLWYDEESKRAESFI